MKIIVLGSDGFVGKNLYEGLSPFFTSYASTRRTVEADDPYRCYFDIDEPSSWEALLQIRPDCIVNCIGYGVVKTQTDVKRMLDVNYFRTASLYEYIGRHLPGAYLIHIGTAFEYYLQAERLTEQSECAPGTYYGAGKLLMSQYLQQRKVIRDFTIIRPFNMFGPYEDTTKIIPTLIRSQRTKIPTPLSEGGQKRDYFFVRDLSKLVAGLVKSGGGHRIVNAGSGRPVSLRELADRVARQLPEFDGRLWEWGELPYREGESPVFFNGSALAAEYGMGLTDLDDAIAITIKYYWNV